MCKECGCGDKIEGESTGNIIVHSHDGHSHSHATNTSTLKLPKQSEGSGPIAIDRSISEYNDMLAHQIAHNLQDMGVLCINLMGSPGSGKTTVIEGIARFISPSEMCVIQGDLESDVDKVRLEKASIDTYQINTHSGCHLNSSMVNKALLGLALKGKKYLIIENVGNLVCPAGVQIGQHMNMVVSSTTEGSDKPQKYPYIFMDSELIVISKIDLAEAVDFDYAQYSHDLLNINGHARIIKTSKKDTESFRQVAEFIEHERSHILGEKHNH